MLHNGFVTDALRFAPTPQMPYLKGRFCSFFMPELAFTRIFRPFTGIAVFDRTTVHRRSFLPFPLIELFFRLHMVLIIRHFQPEICHLLTFVSAGAGLFLGLTRLFMRPSALHSPILRASCPAICRMGNAFRRGSFVMRIKTSGMSERSLAYIGKGGRPPVGERLVRQPAFCRSAVERRLVVARVLRVSGERLFHRSVGVAPPVTGNG